MMDRMDGQVVLDFIMERKRVDDLVQSIKDKRYNSQKHRLLQSGPCAWPHLCSSLSNTLPSRTWSARCCSTRLGREDAAVVKRFVASRNQRDDVFGGRPTKECQPSAHAAAHCTVR